MRNGEYCQLTLQRDDGVDDFLLRTAVKASGRLIEYEQTGLTYKCPSERDSSRIIFCSRRSGEPPPSMNPCNPDFM